MHLKCCSVGMSNANDAKLFLFLRSRWNLIILTLGLNEVEHHWIRSDTAISELKNETEN